MKSLQKGFTLIELMIVVAIIAILAALALPAYQDYTVRAKVSEALTAAASPKSLVSEGFEVNGMTGVRAAIAALNSTPASEIETKYVKSMSISDNGSITVTLQDAGTKSGFPTQAGGKTLVLVPAVGGKNLASGLSGAIDWGCASVSSAVLEAHGIPAPATKGTLPSKYAPSECR
ncbi:MAG: pilin [Neisseriaceae bacterium]|nr:pilin [Neisseriaceae bacterium]